MRIGFDAKRAFLNVSGLGNYSRNILHALSSYYPDNEYFLYTPSAKIPLFGAGEQGYIINEPAGILNKIFKSYWRTFSLAAQLKKDRLDIYHGLSHELPYNINRKEIKTVVTIHDLIFLRYPDLYKSLDRKIYLKKSRYACKTADLIVAISKQTANDIQEFFGIDKSKIEVIYQGCNPVFRKEAGKNEKERIRKKYGFPDSYILYVGSVEERKNLLSLIKAIYTEIPGLPLVVIGRRTNYFNTVKKYIDKNNIKDIYFLEEIINKDLPAVYQSARVFVYPSVFEGFGIPILEALCSKVPVITSRDGCFPEAGGPSSVYVDPKNVEELAGALKKVTEDNELRNKMITEGYEYARNFDDDKVAGNLMKAYLKVIKGE